ncbi:yeast-phase specific protein [Histoplasma capsulatum var. duboisii H88]|uniref:Yeast-phase specific protein n=1 Tax=Ajellomyces capsulatus (strain H88) TaxID=544711 RepID=A0A8A1L9T0_AJEC8|nr:yeast-phase specific protein [Histoplasma capsulatum var. duboisii H88]
MKTISSFTRFSLLYFLCAAAETSATFILKTTLDVGEAFGQLDLTPSGMRPVKWTPDMEYATPVMLDNSTQLEIYDQNTTYYLNWDNSTASTGIYFSDASLGSGITMLQMDADGCLLWLPATQNRNGWMWCYMLDYEYRMFFYNTSFISPPEGCGFSPVCLIPYQNKKHGVFKGRQRF